MLKGSMMIGYQPMSTKGLVNFFRVIVGNPICEKSDMDFIVEEIMRLGDTVWGFQFSRSPIVQKL